jgi:hypothetical protein
MRPFCATPPITRILAASLVRPPAARRGSNASVRTKRREVDGEVGLDPLICQAVPAAHDSRGQHQPMQCRPAGRDFGGEAINIAYQAEIRLHEMNVVISRGAVQFSFGSQSLFGIATHDDHAHGVQCQFVCDRFADPVGALPSPTPCVASARLRAKSAAPSFHQRTEERDNKDRRFRDQKMRAFDKSPVQFGTIEAHGENHGRDGGYGSERRQ